ncbi:hypothetical protein B9Z55_008929 [Caenorhabditis nigoni]|nr:hypothetical protein B9Z55_008929 [Caenorhabditis nigoni]
MFLKRNRNFPDISTMEVFDAPSFVKVFTSFWKLAIPLVPLNLIQPMIEMSATANCTSVDQARVKDIMVS